jgi:hypothetical protein
MTTRLIDDRKSALLIGFKATHWHVETSYDDYVRVAADWDVKAIERDGHVIGAVYSKNGETHVSILPEFRRRWLTKGLLKDILADMTFTRITPGHDFMYNILNRLGFVPQADGTLIREN